MIEGDRRFHFSFDTLSSGKVRRCVERVTVQTSHLKIQDMALSMCAPAFLPSCINYVVTTWL